ncbi:MAG: hypothetical protein K9G13_01890 [Aquiluna sp.]|nr:hypothetical protein [Aquiluna sp.]MCF8545275.1 hypothetical protein [Aquiluna sp.]
MSFPLANQTLLGYAPAQVDALMDRIRIQFENPNLSLVTSKIVEVARFDLVPGGYQVKAVDDAIARVCDTLLERELKDFILKNGRSMALVQLENNLELIRNTLELGAKTAFPKSKTAYSTRKIASLFKTLSVKRGSLSGPSTFELRTMPLGRSASGKDKSAVDSFISTLVHSFLLQRLL